MAMHARKQEEQERKDAAHISQVHRQAVNGAERPPVTTSERVLEALKLITDGGPVLLTVLRAQRADLIKNVEEIDKRIRQITVINGIEHQGGDEGREVLANIMLKTPASKDPDAKPYMGGKLAP
jgi:hypothetical protein